MAILLYGVIASETGWSINRKTSRLEQNCEPHYHASSMLVLGLGSAVLEVGPITLSQGRRFVRLQSRLKLNLATRKNGRKISKTLANLRTSEKSLASFMWLKRTWVYKKTYKRILSKLFGKHLKYCNFRFNHLNYLHLGVYNFILYKNVIIYINYIIYI